MAPYSHITQTQVIQEPAKELQFVDGVKKYEVDRSHKYRIRWKNVAWVVYLHIAGVYGIYLAMFAKWPTIALGFLNLVVAGLGVTVGAHRLFSHRSFRARWPLRLLLTAMQTVAFQNSCIEWARDHRVHHKFTETDADPHNFARGFFFAHIGWIMADKHPKVKATGRKLDVSDLTEDPILRFQHKYYRLLMPLMCFLIPTFIPVYFWDESLSTAWHLNMLRYAVNLHQAMCINSFAHWIGGKTYDRRIAPANNAFASFFSFGEGYHNFHHVFPWDYRTGELTGTHCNPGTLFINLFARLGWAQDLKQVSDEMVKSRVLRTGDGSHPTWGWGDQDLSQEDRDRTAWSSAGHAMGDASTF